MERASRIAAARGVLEMHRKFGWVTLALLLGCATAVVAGPPLARDEALKLMARPGSWIEADGAMQPDGTLLGKDFEIVAPGDTANKEEPAIYGTVENLNRAKSSMKILGYMVQWNADTTFKDDSKRKILSSKVDEGAGVKVQGNLQPNGTFLATKVKLQAVQRSSDGKVKGAKEKVFGPVTVLDARTGRLRVLNTTVTLRPDATLVEAAPQAP